MLHVSAPIDVLIMTSQTYVPHSLSEVISKCFRMVHSSDYKILSEIITKDSLSKIIMQLKCVRYLFHKIWEIKKKEITDLSPVILGDSTYITKPHKPKPRCISQ